MQRVPRCSVQQKRLHAERVVCLQMASCTCKHGPSHSEDLKQGLAFLEEHHFQVRLSCTDRRNSAPEVLGPCARITAGLLSTRARSQR